MTKAACRIEEASNSGRISSTASPARSSTSSVLGPLWTWGVPPACSSRRCVTGESMPGAIDVSAWAIDQVPEALRPFCQVGSITEELEGALRPDHLLRGARAPPSVAGGRSRSPICAGTPTPCLFSSTPDDFDEPTHLNVEPGGYWAQLFFRQGSCETSTSTRRSSRPRRVVPTSHDRRRRDVDRATTSAACGISPRRSGARLQEAVAEHDSIGRRDTTARPAGPRDRAAGRGARGPRSAGGRPRLRPSFEMVRQHEVSRASTRRIGRCSRRGDRGHPPDQGLQVHRHRCARSTAGSGVLASRPSSPSPEPAHPARRHLRRCGSSSSTPSTTPRGARSEIVWPGWAISP